MPGVLQRAGNVVANAGLLTTDNGGEDARSKEERALEVTVAVGGDHGGVALVHGGAENTAATHVAGHVEAGSIFFGTLFAIADAVTHDQARELLVQALPVKAHLGEGFRARVGDEDVCFGEELHHDLEALFALEVQRDEALVEVGHVECEVFLVAGRPCRKRRPGWCGRGRL